MTVTYYYTTGGALLCHQCRCATQTGNWHHTGSAIVWLCWRCSAWQRLSDTWAALR